MRKEAMLEIPNGLERRTLRMLRRMELLSEGGTVRPFGVRIKKSHSGSRMPERKDLSLKEQYENILREVPVYERHKWRTVLLRGEDEIENILGWRTRKDDKIAEFPRERDARIIRMYEGWSAVEAAFAEQCSEALIRKIRKEAERDEMGR